MRTQKLVADYLRQHGWPFAESTGAGRSGVDILGTPGLAWEVKARRDLNPLAWVKQSEGAAGGNLPLVAFRCAGQGEDAGQYLALVRLGDLVPVLRAAGFGTPLEEEPSDTPGSLCSGPRADADVGQVSADGRGSQRLSEAPTSEDAL